MTTYFDEDETNIIYNLAYDLTGLASDVTQKKDVILQNVYQRIYETKTSTLENYLNYLENSEKEFSHFVSALTIHTTSWFRELDHFDIIKKDILNQINPNEKTFIKILSIPCSSGEEVYSLAFLLYQIKENNPSFDFEIYGTDIDPVSIDKAKRAIYLKKNLIDIPKEFQKYLKLGQEKSQDYFAIDKAIREKCNFGIRDLREHETLIASLTSDDSNRLFDYIICRNVFIYFTPSQRQEITKNLIAGLNDSGTLILGHCEKINHEGLGVQNIGHSVYKKEGSIKSKNEFEAKNQIDIVLFSKIDDPLIQSIYKRLTKEFKSVLVIDSSTELMNLSKDKKFRLIFVDSLFQVDLVESCLSNLKKKQPSIFISLVSFANLKPGLKNRVVVNPLYQDFLDWSQYENSASKIILYIKQLFDLNSGSKVFEEDGVLLSTKKLKQTEQIKPFLKEFNPEYIAVGASTGGIEALQQLLKNIPYKTPPIIIVQHLPPFFASEFIANMTKITNLNYVTPHKKIKLEYSSLYIADGDYHVVIKGRSGNLYIEANTDSPKNGLRPSIDVLFFSLAKTRAKGVGVLLTGMGTDGAHGLLALKESNCFTLAQDEASCVIYGMPREARKLDACIYQGNLIQLRDVLEKVIHNSKVIVANSHEE